MRPAVGGKGQWSRQGVARAKTWRRAKDRRPREVGGPARSLMWAVFRGHRGECGNRR